MGIASGERRRRRQAVAPTRPPASTEMALSKSRVGVIGAGVMGTGVAQDLAQNGFEPILLDTAEAALDKARRSVRQAIRAQALVQGAGQREPAAAVLGRITFTGDSGLLRAADFVIENATEDIAVKRTIYAELDRVCPAPCIFIANTSCIPITRLGAFTGRPQQVIGVHFMNPVPLKKTVEMIPGVHTAPETLEKTEALMAELGKACVVVGDSPGFVSNRVLMLTVNEAIFLIQESVAAPKDVDEVFRSCMGHTMGPLETADLIGLDTILNSLRVLHDELGDPKFRPCALLTKMVDAGQLGRKSGRGFYSYA